MLDAGDVRGPRLLHGAGPAAWPLVARAGQLGLPTRAGLEDMLAGPGGALAGGNHDLVRAALALWSGEDQLWRGPAGPAAPGRWRTAGPFTEKALLPIISSLQRVPQLSRADRRRVSRNPDFTIP